MNGSVVQAIAAVLVMNEQRAILSDAERTEILSWPKGSKVISAQHYRNCDDLR